jgi:DNA-binding response OmpR family regulator
VIVDYHMPGLNGVTVLESLRSAAVSANATCMFLLYTSDEETSKRYRELGFDGVLTKKGNMPELIRQLGAHLRIVRLRVLTARR